MKTLFAIPNFECNLSCRYCELKDRQARYDEKKFLEALCGFQGNVVIFGGEPLLFKKRLYKILETGKAGSISTNLLLLDRETADRLKNLEVATTWTPERFDAEGLKSWLRSLQILGDSGIDAKLLITLSEDTLSLPPAEAYAFLKGLENYPISSVLFEQLLDYSKGQEYYERADDWLCEIHEYFKSLRFANEIEEQIMDGWHFDCLDNWTLYPDGEIRRYCPQFSSFAINERCYECPANIACRPCMLQKKCVFPKKLGNIVLGNSFGKGFFT